MAEEARGGGEYRRCAQGVGAPPVLLAASGLPSHLSKAPEGFLDLKTPYIKASDASREGGGA